MHIRYLNGPRLRRALAAGARRVAERAEQLNAINVFPVPDGDTGTNMAATVLTMSRLVVPVRSPSLARTARRAAEGALDGARGNSGAIVAQFFHGLAEEIGDEARMTTRAFARAARRAVERTYAAVSRPREGTILSVLRAWSERLHARAEGMEDFLPLLDEGLVAARDELVRSREILPEAREAGVVDAGAQGFVHFLEGIAHFIREGRLRDAFEGSAALGDALGDALGEDLEAPASEFADPARLAELLASPLGRRYCCEARAAELRVEPAELAALLEGLGDSLICAGGRSAARIHIHSDDPPAVFRAVESVARLATSKVDDMLIQRELAARRPRSVLVVDSTCDLPPGIRDELAIDRVPARLEFDGRVALDGDGVSAADFHGLLAARPEAAGSTSQPSRADFSRKFAFLLSVAGEALYIGPAAALSGTVEAGRASAAALPGGERLLTWDSKAISLASGLIARRAAEAMRGGASAAEAAGLAERLRGGLGLFIAVPALERLVRSGRISRLKGLAARSLGLRPLLRLDAEGRIEKAGSWRAGEDPVEALLAAMRAELAKRAAAAKGAAAPRAVPRRIEAAVAHVGADEAARELARRIDAEFPVARETWRVPAGPAIALHLGPLTMGVAWIEAAP